MFSLLAARLITPMLAAYFLRHHTIVEKPPGIFLRAYTRLVTWSVRHYLVTVTIGLMLFATSVWSIGLLPKGFLPAQDSSKSRLAIELPPGSRLADTERVTEEIVKRLRLRPEVNGVFVDGGREPRGAKEIRRASIFVNYTPRGERSVTQHDLELSIGRELDDMPDMRYWFIDDQALRAISLDVTGADSTEVANVAEELATQMRRLPLVANVISETALERPELRIRPRIDMLARLGVTTEGLSETIRIATMGDVGAALARFDTGDRLVPIRVQLEDRVRTNLQIMEQLRVPTVKAYHSARSPTCRSIRGRQISIAGTATAAPP
jgi:multidrug efflux pump subunit AcrB